MGLPFNGTPTITRKTITAGAAAVQIADAIPGRICLLIVNTGTVAVYLGTDATVTDSTGWPLQGWLAPYDLLPDTQIQGPLYAYAAAGTDGHLAIWDNHR